ncbi:F-box/WD repeat-containing protein 4 isoform X2 [Clupea harengus]|uniref:F-box/WD repeat-containing protein 4 isoform X2 n=1 Tax=Clupea harengus TaxID=7950 RepID=A0A6P3WDT1_CLUHA|nr:F-box/WD repeat-containing protein 4 isoform X2 [Clupea harengus]
MCIFQLPDDVLYLILSYLDCKSLCRLSQVCRKLYHFTSRDAVWRKIAKDLINTGITRQGGDLYPCILLKDRVRTSQNWSQGCCRKEVLMKWKPNLLPWIQLDGDVLYLSQAADIGAYHLRPRRGRFQHSRFALFSGHQEDVCRFVLTDTHLISAGGDGKIIIHNRRDDFSMEFYGHNQEVNCIDSKGGLIVSGSRDRTARIWTLSPNRLGECLHTIPTFDRVWSVAISPSIGTFVTGTACCEDSTPLRIWDTERCQLVSCLGADFRRGAGVLDIIYESPSQLLTCGYDTFIRYWDLRVSSRKCVMEWEEPHDSALYCMQTDGNQLIVSGSSYYGVVRLWDKRQTHCLKMFQLTSSTSSPVYCLRLNASHLYAALASALYCLDFTAPGPRARR